MEHKAAPPTGAGKPRCLIITYSTDSGAQGSVAVPYRRLWALILVSVLMGTWCMATASGLVALALSPSASKVAFLAMDSLAELAESLSLPSPAVSAEVAPTDAVAKKKENVAQPTVVASVADSPQRSAREVPDVKAEAEVEIPPVAKADVLGGSVSVEPELIAAAQPELLAAAKPDSTFAAQPKLTGAGDPASQRQFSGSPAELIRLERVRFEASADKLEARLFITPQVPGASVRGHFFARAVFQTSSGVLRVISIPAKTFIVKVEPTREDLVFTAPRGAKGSFIDLTLTLTVVDHDQPLVARYPIRTRKAAATAKFLPDGADDGAVLQ